MFNLKDIFLKFLHIVFALGLIYLVVVVFYIDLDIAGERVIHHSIDNQHVMVSGPEPEARLNNVELFTTDPYWEIFVDPVYFDLILPRQYNTVDVVIKYKAKGVPFIQLGAQTSETGWNFTWNGIQNLGLEKIDWSCLRNEERGWWLCQREPNYTSIENFLLGPPQYSRIVNYNFPLPEGFDRLNVVGFNHLMDLEEYDYVIAKYDKINPSDEWIESISTYNIGDLYQQGPKLKFVISSPGLDNRGQTIQIKSIDFILHKPVMTKEIFFKKLKDKLFKD